MNPAMPVTQATAPLADRLAFQASLDAERAQDLYVVWKMVFEHAQAGQSGSHDAARSPAPDPRLGDVKPATDTTAAVWAPWAGARDTLPTTLPLESATAATFETASSAVALGPRASAAVKAVQGAMPALARSVAALRDEPPLRSTMPEPGRNAAAPADAPDPMPDSVNVFVRGAAVSITVRDPAMSAHEAVRCGFETARRLTGQRAALQQLTLNGHTLYQNSDAPALEQARPGPVLVFAC